MASFYDPAVSFFQNDVFGSAKQPGYLGNPGIGPFATNLGLALMAAGSGGNPVGTSRFAQAAPFLQQAVNAPMQARQQALMGQLYGAQVDKLKADAAREQAQREGRVNLRNQLTSASMLPMTETEGGAAPSFMSAVPVANRQMAASMLDAGADVDKVLPSLLPKPLDPKDRYVPVPGVGLVDVSGGQPQTVVAQGKEPPAPPSGYKWMADGTQTFVPGGPADPKVIEANRPPKDDKGFDHAKALRAEFTDQTKDYRIIEDAHAKITKAAENNTGASDMALLYNFVKLLDPSSVVRESEFETAAKSGSYGERIQGLVNRILTGQRLPDSLRQDFLKEADSILDAQAEGYERTAQNYRGLAKRYGVEESDVIQDYRNPTGRRAASGGKSKAVKAKYGLE